MEPTVIVDDEPEATDGTVSDDAPAVLIEDDDFPDEVLERGVPGPAGLSAYQLAQSLGYQGSLAEWLGADKAYADELAAAQAQALEDHRTAAEPHPVYDDMTDLSALFSSNL